MKARIALIVGRIAAVALPVLLLTSCFEQSIVVKVNKDGSGIVHERTYENNAMMEGMMSGFGAAIGAAPGGDSEETVESSESDTPSETELKEAAAAMGEGVTFKSMTEGKNKAGWPGFEVIYEFTDINTLKIDMDSLSSNSGEAEFSIGSEEPAAEKPAEFVTFEMADGILKIKTPDPSKSLSDAGGGGEAGGPDGEGAPGGAANPFGNADPSDPQAAMGMQMMAGMMAGMRIGMFVEGADPIAKTNARHQNGNVLTLMMIDMGKVLQNPANTAKMDSLESPDMGREEMQKVIDEIDGFTADLQEPIVVEFQ